MKAVLLLSFALVAVIPLEPNHKCIAQTISGGCSSYTSAAECQATDRCLWDRGRSCNGDIHGFCRARTEACGDALTCARSANTASPFTFPHTCIPAGWTAIPMENCRCEPEDRCDNCGDCEVCRDGECVAQTDFTCSDENRCPVGYECMQSTCGSKCVPQCPRTVPQVNCFVDPCDLPAPEGCDTRAAICISDNCGGCNRRYVDQEGNEVCKDCSEGDCGDAPPADTLTCVSGETSAYTGRCISVRGNCVWERRECPAPTCEPVSCRLHCPNGFKRDESGCPICECNDPRDPCADTRECPRIQCGDGEHPVIPEGACCPVCRSCRGVTCPPIRCADGFESVIPSGKCCPECVPVNQCGDCPAPPTCSRTEELVRDRCGCGICRPVVDCRDVECVDIEEPCPAGTKAVVNDGGCCRTCEPINNCDRDFECPQLTCQDGEELVRSDLSCCPVCRPRDISDRCVSEDQPRCAVPTCPRSELIRREGMCCPQCPQCSDSETRVCTLNDDSVCRMGLYRGENCEEEVPATERRVREFAVRYCSREEPCARPSEQTIRKLIAEITGVNPAMIRIVSVTRIEDVRGCCFLIKVEIVASTSDDVDVDAVLDTIARALAEGDFDFEFINEEPSSASVATASLLFAGVASAALFL